MHLLIAGATGRTGRILTGLALEHGHTVTALVRKSSEPLPAQERLDSVVVDVLAPDSLPPAFVGVDAVISLLAPRPRVNGRVYVEGTRNLADAAAAAGVRRFVAVSAEGAGVDPKTVPLLYRLVMRIPVVAKLYPDIARMERDLAARTDLDWTLVAPAILTNRPYTGEYRVREGAAVVRGLMLSRDDLAHFLLDTVERDAYVRERVTVAR